ncbi:MAG: hypothetical protein OEZ06_07735 [Myxococcales bacterium]|nr:hypothetical protein [Myxococcales bacterium]
MMTRDPSTSRPPSNRLPWPERLEAPTDPVPSSVSDAPSSQVAVAFAGRVPDDALQRQLERRSRSSVPGPARSRKSRQPESKPEPTRPSFLERLVQAYRRVSELPARMERGDAELGDGAPRRGGRHPHPQLVFEAPSGVAAQAAAAAWPSPKTAGFGEAEADYGREFDLGDGSGAEEHRNALLPAASSSDAARAAVKDARIPPAAHLASASVAGRERPTELANADSAGGRRRRDRRLAGILDLWTQVRASMLPAAAPARPGGDSPVVAQPAKPPLLSWLPMSRRSAPSPPPEHKSARPKAISTDGLTNS